MQRAKSRFAMTQEYLKILAQKFLDGTATEAEKRLLHEWYDAQNSDLLETETVLTAKEETPEDVKSQMLANLKEWQNQSTESKIPQFTLIKRFASWSTAVAAAVVIGFFFWVNKNKPSTNESNIVSVHAPFGKTLEVKLPDGSLVWLNAGSSMTYPKSFSENIREVILKEGQAFFEVVHLAKHPFVVHAKTLDITVLGTSFDVKAYANDPDIKVTVKTGKVGVTQHGKPEIPALMLLPAEQATLPQSINKIQVSEISTPAIAPWKDNRLVFDDELISDVFRVLERKYNQHIVIEKAGLAEEKISLTLDNQPMTDVLKVLGFSKKFNYSQLNDSTIVIR